MGMDNFIFFHKSLADYYLAKLWLVDFVKDELYSDDNSATNNNEISSQSK